MKYKVLTLILFLLITLANAQLTWTTMFQMAPDTLIDGMVWDGEYLWITAEGPPPRIFKLDSLGVKIDTLPAPGSQPTGLTWDGNHLWVGSHGTRRIYKVDPITGSVETSFVAPGAASNEGLAFDGTYLWNTNWNNDIIWKLDTLGAQQGQFPAPGTGSTGLTWDGTYLWNSDQDRDSVYRIDPGNGQVIRREPGPPDPVIQDLAFDGTCLWTCGYYTGSVYRSSPLVGIKDNRTKTQIIATFELKLYPNPCLRNIILSYQLLENSNINITIYDATGTLVSTLFEGQREAGVYESQWHRPSSIPAGIYFLRFKTKDFSATKRFVVLN
jgi:DNA-binding beta-propeller fold protein YncE